MRGIFAMEENQEVLATEPTDATVDVTEFTEAAEAPMLEMNEAAAELEQVVEDIEAAADTADTLEVMEQNVEKQIQEEGGLAEPAAATIEVAVEHMRVQLGFPKSKGKVFALEGFSDKATRVQATKLALESIKDTAKKIWEGILNAFNQAVKWVKEFFSKLFDTTKRLEKRAEDLAKAASAAKDKTAPADAKVDGAGWGAATHVGGKLLEGGAFVSAYAEACKNTKASNEQIDKFSTDLTKALEEALANVGKAEFKLGVVSSKEIKAPEGFTVPEGMKLGGTELGLGDQAFFILSSATQETISSTIGKTKVFVSAKAGAAKFEKGEVAPLTVGQVEELAKVAKTQMASHAGTKEALAVVGKVETGVMAKIKAISKDTKEQTAEAKTHLKVATQAARANVTLVSSGFAAGRGYDVRVTKAALDYAAKSLKLAV